MNTTGPVMTVTDELIEQLEALTCIDEGGAVLIHTDQVRCLLSELSRLRAENSELEQSLAESRANDQAAMGWLTSLRWASGDRGDRMLPELVTHIEGLAKDAGRYRWIKAQGFATIRPANNKITLFTIASQHVDAETLDTAIDTAIDTAMATN